MADVNLRPDQTVPQNILHPPSSAYAKEMVKWEAQGSILGPGLRPYEKSLYPMMLHRAGELPGGLGIGIIETEISEKPDTLRDRHLRSRGFCDTPLEALEYFQKQQDEFAKLAAEREYDKAKKLSARAREEVNAAEEAAGSRHLPAIAETPVKKRRPYQRKAKAME